MLRVHFTAQDLMRVEFASRPAPLMELGLAAATLQRPDRNVVFAGWGAARRREIPPAALPLFALVPPNGAGPLFLDPLSDALDEGMDGILFHGTWSPASCGGCVPPTGRSRRGCGIWPARTAGRGGPWRRRSGRPTRPW